MYNKFQKTKTIKKILEQTKNNPSKDSDGWIKDFNFTSDLACVLHDIEVEKIYELRAATGDALVAVVTGVGEGVAEVAKIVAKAFFATHLPIHILEAINLDTLSLCGENFITKNLKKYSSDLIYKVCFKTSNNVNNQWVLYLLTEHESGVNPIMPIKLYNYINLIIQKHLKQHRNKKVLPLVYSIVYYTGKKTLL